MSSRGNRRHPFLPARGSSTCAVRPLALLLLSLCSPSEPRLAPPYRSHSPSLLRSRAFFCSRPQRDLYPTQLVDETRTRTSALDVLGRRRNSRPGRPRAFFIYPGAETSQKCSSFNWNV
ncbi:hypothetical protein HNY73_012993 [Argiope bruennichi]|uniref:Uncharacterized protein n=1 Tax=Argiope bruennichi TaxID=94029 RepID=A0A8T0F1G1_ARGBR|nr:hypothetical protein HNY73_012993 [Argiope bruennichi]